MRVLIHLRCEKCKKSTYTSRKNKMNTPDRLSLSKYCRFCKSHTAHVETK